MELVKATQISCHVTRQLFYISLSCNLGKTAEDSLLHAEKVILNLNIEIGFIVRVYTSITNLFFSISYSISYSTSFNRKISKQEYIL